MPESSRAETESIRRAARSRWREAPIGPTHPTARGEAEAAGWVACIHRTSRLANGPPLAGHEDDPRRLNGQGLRVQDVRLVPSVVCVPGAGQSEMH